MHTDDRSPANTTVVGRESQRLSGGAYDPPGIRGGVTKTSKSDMSTNAFVVGSGNTTYTRNQPIHRGGVYATKDMSSDVCLHRIRKKKGSGKRDDPSVETPTMR